MLFSINSCYVTIIKIKIRNYKSAKRIFGKTCSLEFSLKIIDFYIFFLSLKKHLTFTHFSTHTHTDTYSFSLSFTCTLKHTLHHGHGTHWPIDVFLLVILLDVKKISKVWLNIIRSTYFIKHEIVMILGSLKVAYRVRGKLFLIRVLRLGLLVRGLSVKSVMVMYVYLRTNFKMLSLFLDSFMTYLWITLFLYSNLYFVPMLKNVRYRCIVNHTATKKWMFYCSIKWKSLKDRKQSKGKIFFSFVFIFYVSVYVAIHLYFFNEHFLDTNNTLILSKLKKIGF